MRRRAGRATGVRARCQSTASSASLASISASSLRSRCASRSAVARALATISSTASCTPGTSSIETILSASVARITYGLARALLPCCALTVHSLSAYASVTVNVAAGFTLGCALRGAAALAAGAVGIAPFGVASGWFAALPADFSASLAGGLLAGASTVDAGELGTIVSSRWSGGLGVGVGAARGGALRWNRQVGGGEGQLVAAEAHDHPLVAELRIGEPDDLSLLSGDLAGRLGEDHLRLAPALERVTNLLEVRCGQSPDGCAGGDHRIPPTCGCRLLPTSKLRHFRGATPNRSTPNVSAAADPS